VKLKKSILICCIAWLAGCVGHYQQPASSAPHATLEAKWGTNNLMNGGSQAYWAYHDRRCQDTTETGVLGALSQTEPAKNRFLIKADQRIYLTAASMGIIERKSSGDALIHRSCMNASSFVPEVGVTYQATHSATESACSLAVVDTRTGQAPTSLVVETISKECGF